MYFVTFTENKNRQRSQCVHLPIDLKRIIKERKTHLDNKQKINEGYQDYINCY